MQSVCGYPFYPSAAIQKLKYMADSYLWEKYVKQQKGICELNGGRLDVSLRKNKSRCVLDPNNNHP